MININTETVEIFDIKTNKTLKTRSKDIIRVWTVTKPYVPNKNSYIRIKRVFSENK